MQLVKWKRNDLFKAITEGGLDPRECTFDYDDAGGRITHVPSESYFLIEGDIGNYNATAVVGENPPWPSESFSWTKVEKRVRRWAEEVKHDVDTPDLWAQLQRERQALTVSRYEDAENTPFSPAEQAEIAEQLRQIKNFAKVTYTLSEAQMASLDEKLDMIQAAAGRIGRKDWQILVIGVMSTLIIDRLLPPEAVQHIFATVLQALTHLFLPLLPQPPLLTG
jgi:hypothetical protein